MPKSFINISEKDKIFYKKMKFYTILIFLLTNFISGQTLSSSLNKNNVDLGEHIILNIHIRNLQGKNVISAQKNGLLPFYFEETKDEIYQNNKEYRRTIEFSILDEGKFILPSLEFKIGDSIHKSIPYEIKVTNPNKKNEEISDIMPNQEIELGIMDYLSLYQNQIFIFLIILGSILMFIFIKKRSVKKKISPNISPNKFLHDLAQLKPKKLIESGEHRLFYIKLLEIIRDFLQSKYQIPADILLTDDLIDFIKKSHILSKENTKILEELFIRGDLVKFAKSIPSSEMMQVDLENVENFIMKNL